MKIAMVGSGAAGSVFASYLRAGGADMTLIDPYKAHMDAVRDNGMKFTIYPDKTTVLTGFHTAYTADEVDTMDIVIFMTKANQLESAIQGAKHCIGPNTVLVSLINGLGNDDKLLKFYPASRCMVGSGVIGTALDGPGGCVSTPSEGVIMNFGALENNELTVAAGKYMEDCFNKGGCEAVFREDVLPFIWKKSAPSPYSPAIRVFFSTGSSSGVVGMYSLASSYSRFPFTLRAEYMGGTCSYSPTKERTAFLTSSSVRPETSAVRRTVPVMSSVSVSTPKSKTAR